MNIKEMQWRREADENLYLYIHDGDGKWIRYTNHKHYQPDYKPSSNSGFRTFQYLLKLGYNVLHTDS